MIVWERVWDTIHVAVVWRKIEIEILRKIRRFQEYHAHQISVIRRWKFRVIRIEWGEIGDYISFIFSRIRKVMDEKISNNCYGNEKFFINLEISTPYLRKTFTYSCSYANRTNIIFRWIFIMYTFVGHIKSSFLAHYWQLLSLAITAYMYSKASTRNHPLNSKGSFKY